MTNIDLLTEAEVAMLRQLIEGATRIIITGHKSPDGDAMGSCLGWAEYLRAQWGKDPVVLMPDAFPDFLQWLPNTDKVIRYDKRREQGDRLLREADLVCCLDFNGFARVDEMEQALTQSPARKLMIDHHLAPTEEGIDLLVSHPEMSSTSELVFRMIWQMGGFEQMDRRCAAQLYCGMMTDTGGFTFNSTRPEIYFIISQLLTKGIDKDKIYRNVYNNYSCWAIRLRGYLLSRKLNYLSDCHASYFTITRKDMVDYHFVKGDAEGLVNEPLRIKGLKLSISLREDDRRDNLIWVSLRSVDDFPCNEVAQQFFNGGGHLNASGGKLFCSMDEAERVTRRAIHHYEELLRK